MAGAKASAFFRSDRLIDQVAAEPSAAQNFANQSGRLADRIGKGA
jgi:hypothetical protein